MLQSRGVHTCSHTINPLIAKYSIVHSSRWKKRTYASKRLSEDGRVDLGICRWLCRPHKIGHPDIAGEEMRYRLSVGHQGFSAQEIYSLKKK